MPTSAHAAVYSATRHYLRAIEAAGTDEAKAVMAKMREMPINDFFAKNGKLREDGRMVHDMYLVEVKTLDNNEALLTRTSLINRFHRVGLPSI